MQEYLKVVWAYMLENGRETTGEWSYYGSDYESIPGRKWNYDYRGELLQRVKTIGVDWSKTKEPTSSVENGFAGTFADHSDEQETLLGTLFLNDGTSYIIGCRDEDGMGSYISNFLKYSKDVNRIAAVFGEDNA